MTGQKIDQISQSNQVNINNFSRENAGLYQCHVTNEIIIKSNDTDDEEDRVQVFDHAKTVNITVAGECRLLNGSVHTYVFSMCKLTLSECSHTF